MRLMKLRDRVLNNFRDPQMRANVLALAGGKIIGLALVLSAIYAWIGSPLQAQAAAAGPTPEMNAINTAWTLIAAFLVFGMQVGFVMLEAGFARSRESVNILVEGIVDTCICGVTFWAWGFAFMFMNGNGFIGYHGWFLKGIPEVYGSTGVPLLAYWVFQFAFADTCSTITSGAMVGRCGFVGDILYSIGVTGFIYPIIGHWSWCPSVTSPGRPSSIRLAAPFRSSAPSRSVRVLDVSSSATAAGRCCRTTSSLGRLVG